MVNFRHTDNVPSRGGEAKSAKGRTFSIPPESVGEVRGANFQRHEDTKKPPSMILGGGSPTVSLLPRSVETGSARSPQPLATTLRGFIGGAAPLRKRAGSLPTLSFLWLVDRAVKVKSSAKFEAGVPKAFFEAALNE